MAQQIRNKNNLATVRLKLLQKRVGSLVELTSYRGTERLHRVEVSSNDIGIINALDERVYEKVEFGFPSQIAEELSDSLNYAVGPEGAKWLQVGRSDGELAVVPWERVLRPYITGPLLRIPNFLTPPRYLRSSMRMVICVSAPWDANEQEALRYCSLLTDIVNSIWTDGEVHVFSDHLLFPHLQQLPNAIVHDPEEATQYRVDVIEQRSSRSYIAIENEWLAWITGKVGCVDHIHFICPSFFNRNHGALALRNLNQASPERLNEVHGIEAAELISTLNDLGAWSIAMSALNDKSWNRPDKDHDEDRRIIGLRLIADRLAWKRPGPIYLDDLGASKIDPSHVAQAYMFLFAPHHVSPPSSPHFMLYSHPGRLKRDDTYNGLKDKLGARAYSKDIEASIDDLARSFREPTGTMKDQQPWKQSAERLIDQALFEKVGQGKKGSRGALRAIKKMQELLANKY